MPVGIGIDSEYLEVTDIMATKSETWDSLSYVCLLPWLLRFFYCFVFNSGIFQAIIYYGVCKIPMSLFNHLQLQSRSGITVCANLWCNYDFEMKNSNTIAVVLVIFVINWYAISLLLYFRIFNARCAFRLQMTHRLRLSQTSENSNYIKLKSIWDPNFDKYCQLQLNKEL